jgi:hypothetical protein
MRQKMAWRPNRQLIDGELDNTTPGRVTGWLRFLGLAEPVKLDLEGDFHRDIRGARIRLKNQEPRERERGYMEGFCTRQTGKVGDITAGLPRVTTSIIPTWSGMPKMGGWSWNSLRTRSR